MREKRVIDRAKLERALEATRAYYSFEAEPGDKELLEDMFSSGRDAGDEAGLGIGVIHDFLSCIIRYDGLNQEADLKTVRKALKALGWKVK